MLEVRLDNLFFENKNIYVNVPRFGRKSEATSEGNLAFRDSNGFRTFKRSMSRTQRELGGKVERRSFTEEVINAEVDNAKSFKSLVSLLEYNTKEEELMRFRKEFVGLVVTPGHPITSKLTFKWKNILLSR